MNNNSWCEQSDELLKYLYQDLKIFNWDLISKELSQRLGIRTDSAACRARYAEKCGPVVRDEWTPEQEKQLYRLHNQNGNKWAIIAQNLLGRNDNCVKNHFYSKLRKSLRTINKITKLYLKKQAKEVSDVVLYKLTEATDESLKQNSDLSKEIVAMCYDLKNRLLEYEIDQKDIRGGVDYSFEKELILGLCQFNKVYKKKPKKEKITILGTENLKKRGNQSKKKGKKREPGLKYMEMSFQQEQSYKNSSSESIQIRSKKRQPKKPQAQSQHNPQSNLNNESQQSPYIYRPPRSESEYSVPKKTLNYLIKAPTPQQKIDYQRPFDLMSESKKSNFDGGSHIVIPILAVSVAVEPRPKNKVEDILKAEGILENGEYGGTGAGNRDYFRRSSSARSFSVCSESSHPDMFGEDLVFAGFKELSEMDNESHIFNNQQNQ